MEKLALTIDEAAEAASVSDDVIRKAIRRGTLTASYPSSRPVIRVAELERWLTDLPSEYVAEPKDARVVPVSSTRRRAS